MNKFIVSILLLAGIAIASVAIYKINDDRVKHHFVGRFEYQVVNKEKFRNTFLYDENFRYSVIRKKSAWDDLQISGIDKLKEDKDYLLSMHHPVLEINTTQDGLMYLAQEPILAILDTTFTSKHVYVYEIGEVNSYRMVGP